jgi:hypothetical protein
VSSHDAFLAPSPTTTRMAALSMSTKERRAFPTTPVPIPATNPPSSKLLALAFVPGAPNSDLYGAINCNDTNSVGKKSLAAITAPSASASTPSRLKSGPPLLEIRRLKYVPFRKGKSSIYCSHEDEEKLESDNNDGRSEEDGAVGNSTVEKHKQFHSEQLFEHETVLVSRGISGLGGNVSSTCLSFRPLTDQQNQTLLQIQHGTQDALQALKLPTVVRCATGLTSGALCIHTISDLFDDDTQPSSTVAHFAPRQQRPVTSVAWCPSSSKNSRLVAIGLTGSGVAGGGGTKPGLAGQTSVTGRKGPPIRVAGPPGSGLSPSAGADRDFGCLVWDVEAQSSGSVPSGKAGAAVAVKSKSRRHFYLCFEGRHIF